MNRRLVERRVVVAVLVAAALAVAVITLPLFFRGRFDNRFAAVGSWAGGILGGLSLVGSIGAIATAVYLASPAKEELNRLEKSRVRALETLDALSVAIELVLKAEGRVQPEIDQSSQTRLARQILRKTASQTQTVLDAAVEDGLLRLLTFLDKDLDPFDTTGSGSQSNVLCLMATQGLLAWVETGADGFTPVQFEDLKGFASQLYDTLRAAAKQVASGSGAVHREISASLHDAHRAAGASR